MLKYDKETWDSYYYQIKEILQLEPRHVLEVGCGTKTVSTYLNHQGIQVETADFDKRLKPDHLIDVKYLSKKFKDDSFDVILCAEVLEHLPFKYFDKSLMELAKVTRDKLILTLPYHAIKFRVSFKASLSKEKVFKFSLPFPSKHKFDGQHHWEIGYKGYSRRKIRNIISNHFYIIREYLVPEHQDHRVYVLQKYSKSDNKDHLGFLRCPIY